MNKVNTTFVISQALNCCFLSKVQLAFLRKRILCSVRWTQTLQFDWDIALNATPVFLSLRHWNSSLLLLQKLTKEVGPFSTQVLGLINKSSDRHRSKVSKPEFYIEEEANEEVEGNFPKDTPMGCSSMVLELLMSPEYSVEIFWLSHRDAMRLNSFGLQCTCQC